MKEKTSQVVTNALLEQKIVALTTAVETGFKGIHERQDTTNGKVIKAGEDIIAIQKENVARDAKFQYNRIIWYLLTTSVSVVIALASYIVLK
jgi:hypothetical protein